MSEQEKIDYKNCLSTARMRKSSQSGRTILPESESDRGRVLYSPAFRRLQQKAQVFSMEPNAAVRSRLTHSLEVSQIGRYIADELGLRLKAKERVDVEQQGALVNFVETACLIHDIGNPPFGHFGEAAIQQWFRQKGLATLRSALGHDTASKETSEVANNHEASFKQILTDFDQFDGNPQGFRIVTRLQWNTDKYGLNLTHTTLATFLKYLRSPMQQKGNDFFKKPGFFVSEQKLVHDVWNHFGIDHKNPRRFPLNYIMEAADDIAYCISDLEDSFEKGIVLKEHAFPEIVSKYKELSIKYNFSESSCEHSCISSELDKIILAIKNKDVNYTYTNFRTSLNRTIVNYVVERYMSFEADIASGKLLTLLPENEPPGAILEVLKEYCRTHVYSHNSVQSVELAGYAAITGLLDKFERLLSLSKDDFLTAMSGESDAVKRENLVIESKLLSLFPERQKLVYFDHCQESSEVFPQELWEWNGRAHLVVDFISGMTDDFAVTTYQNLAGMRL